MTPSTTTDTRVGDASPLLKRVFQVDRAISLASAVVLMTFSGAFGNLLGWDTIVVAALGAVLVPFGLALHVIIARRLHTHWLAKATIAADFGWVAASIAVIATLSNDASSAAPWLIGAQALVIADIGLAKIVGLRRSAS